MSSSMRPSAAKIIRVDGAEEPLDPSLTMSAIATRIGAETLDVVSLRSFGEPLWVMLVDDNGYESRAEERDGTTYLIPIRARKPVNVKATALYAAQCGGQTTHQIVGDVAIVLDGDHA